MINRKGYSLIEILVVIALLSIVIVMTTPNINYFKNLRESLEIKELKRDILFARNKAIIECKIYEIKFIQNENSYVIHTASNIKSNTIKHKSFEHGIKLNIKNGSKTFRFNPNGTITNSDTIYFYNRNGIQYRLSITPVTCQITIKKDV